MSNNTTPGRHPSFKDSHFSQTERKIIEKLSKEFFLTNGGETIRNSENSTYRYLLAKPTDIYEEMFNLDREIIFLFSEYPNTQARTIESFDLISKKQSELRIEKICVVIISNDDDIENSLDGFIRNDLESKVIIPFKYKEIAESYDNFFFRNRFRKYVYGRDLFAFEAPLKTDTYFFGRNDIIQQVIGRFKNRENSGLFGLRKTGKTSLINGIERNLTTENIKTIIIDCQNTSFNQRRWNEALYYLCLKAHNKIINTKENFKESDFTEKNASLKTEEILKNIRKKTNHPILFVFDEIENISQRTSPAKHWSSGIDFALFWQTMRSIFQRESALLSFIIVGTNPSCIENPKIENVDNPLFNHFTPIYIPGFDVKQTRDMVRKLGRRMGLSFDETIYSRLTEDFGGHPFLIRHVCSLISKMTEKINRPIQIDRKLYNQAKNEFTTKHANYVEMIIDILKNFYIDEYDMLTFLATDDLSSFTEFAQTNPSYTTHLCGYGIVKNGPSGYDFNIDSVREYLLTQLKYKKTNLSIADKWKEISERRNSAETKLRKIVRLVLKAHHGEPTARSITLDIIGGKRKEKLSHLNFSDLYNSSKSEIYFIDLAKIISKQWNDFSKIFSSTKRETFEKLETINAFRIDAHASEISEEEFVFLRLAMSNIEEDIDAST